ncbi:MAG: STN domain-containing protein [Janthinobacterium lividum]
MLSTRIVSCFVVLAHMLAASTLAGAQHPTSSQPVKARINMGHCDQQVVYNLPAQRFDETAIAIAHATGCFIRYTDQSLVNIPVQPVRGRLTRRQALRVALRGTALRIVRETPNLMEVMRVPAR